jgi:hypothetical protein
MKKLYSVLLVVLLMFSVLPLVFAEAEEDTGDIEVTVGNDNAPVIFNDPTDRSWNPNDQTVKTADLYGDELENAFCDSYFDLDVRGNYLFTGETVSYYVGIYDEDGEDDIDDVTITKEGVGVGSCTQIAETACKANAAFANDAWVNAHFSITGTEDVPEYDSTGGDANDDLFAFYRCLLVVDKDWREAMDIGVKVTDRSTPANMDSIELDDDLVMNPKLGVDLRGTIDFGSLEEGSSKVSNVVSLDNVCGSEDIGCNAVVMDMYIAASDYFTDPSDPTAICGVANGIPHCAFKYLATKGSLDSGDNDNAFSGLGLSGTPSFLVPGCVDLGLTTKDIDCDAENDEFTRVPSHSGDIEDMCRIINHREESSFLIQGDSMSMKFKLEVPTPCEGSFTNGNFNFVGRVV